MKRKRKSIMKRKIRIEGMEKERERDNMNVYV